MTDTAYEWTTWITELIIHPVHQQIYPEISFNKCNVAWYTVHNVLPSSVQFIMLYACLQVSTVHMYLPNDGNMLENK